MGIMITHHKLSYEVLNGYDEIFILDGHWKSDHNIPQGILEKYIQDIPDEDDNKIIKKGFYANNISYQNKGVENEWYQVVKSEYIHFGREIFEKAYECVKFECQDSFKEDFLDNFDEERSFLLAMG